MITKDDVSRINRAAELDAYATANRLSRVVAGEIVGSPAGDVPRPRTRAEAMAWLRWAVAQLEGFGNG